MINNQFVSIICKLSIFMFTIKILYLKMDTVKDVQIIVMFVIRIHHFVRDVGSTMLYFKMSVLNAKRSVWNAIMIVKII